ncbi:hypothetical protein PYW07_008749 [Mythimna separata]|uniref:Uncharacterized protein n=1 Tax=Mythimna separata TaxID=271217 RepID=A0AAD7YE22_MYTSE|nr:hypothetical protein PYW07_008749 [Mythimna separata]
MWCVDAGETPTSGPFKISIASIADCTNPSKPYMKNPPVTFQSYTNNSTLSGNITFLRDTRYMKIRLRGFVLSEGKWKPAYLINNLDCHGLVLHLMCVTMNIKYDRKECRYFKGFKTSIVSVKDCVIHDRPFIKNLPMLFDPVVRNVHGKNMLSGNLTVLKDIKDVKIKVNSYSWKNDKWRQYQSFNNLDCHGTMLYFSFGALRIKYDRKRCMFFKGFYSFGNIDVNQMQHIWVSSMPYGRVLWRVDSYTNGGLFVCKEFDTVTEPAYH